VRQANYNNGLLMGPSTIASPIGAQPGGAKRWSGWPSPEVRASAAYFFDSAQSAQRNAQDDAATRRLWQVSEQAVC
jgi:hypothetical protein